MTRNEYIKNFNKVYNLVTIISKKENCEIYRYRNKQNNKDIVLRSYSEQIISYEELLKIKHENLPEIFDVIYADDGIIVLEEFINGLTVAEVMESGKYNYSGAKKIVNAVCEALTVLHNLNLVHRDVKPENVIIDKNGRVVLIDFDVSRKISKAGKDTVVMGTIGYASPEQLGIAQSDARTDIYALGVLLNVMLTGKHPSECLPKGKAGKIVRKCTVVNPNERYQTAQKLSNAL